MGGIVGKSNLISDSLGERQEEIEQLTNARLVLHRLKAALDVPRKIKAAVQAGALDIAADTYADVLPLLKVHGDKAALKAMAAQTDILRGEVAEKLKQRLTTQPEEAADCVQSLAKLGEPIDSLRNHFLDCSKIKMHTILAKLDNIDNTSAIIAQHSTAFFDELQHISRVFLELFDPSTWRPQLLIMARECLMGYIKRVKACLLSASSAATAAAAGLLIAPQGGRGDSSGGRKKVKLQQASLDILTEVNSLPSLHQNKGKATLSSSSMTETNKNNNTSKISNDNNTEPALLSLASTVQATFLDSWGAESLLQLLTTIRSDLYRIQQSVPSSSSLEGGRGGDGDGAATINNGSNNVNCALPELAPGDRAAEVVEATVRGHVGAAFTALRQRMQATISTTIDQAVVTISNSAANNNNNDNNTLVGLVLVNALVLETGSQKLLKNLRVFYNNNNSGEEGGNWVLGAWSDIFASTLHAQLQEVVMSIITALSIDNDNNKGGSRVLNFKRALCGVFSKGCSRQLECQLHQLHPNGSGYSSSLVSNQFDSLATNLLGRYREMEIEGVVAAVKGAIAGGGGRREDGWGVEWANFDEEEDRSEQPSSSSGGGGGVGKRPSELATQLATKLKSTLQEMEDMDAVVLLPTLQALDKLSNNNTNINNDTAMNREGEVIQEREREVLIAVAHAGLTAYLDILRREGSFSRMGFQQVQLDAHWLRGQLSDMLFKHTTTRSGVGGGDDRRRGTGVAVIQMLDDVVAAAAERCSEPRMFEVAALDRIIAALHNNSNNV